MLVHLTETLIQTSYGAWSYYRNTQGLYSFNCCACFLAFVLAELGFLAMLFTIVRQSNVHTSITVLHKLDVHQISHTILLIRFPNICDAGDHIWFIQVSLVIQISQSYRCHSSCHQSYRCHSLTCARKIIFVLNTSLMYPSIYINKKLIKTTSQHILILFVIFGYQEVFKKFLSLCMAFHEYKYKYFQALHLVIKHID